MKRFDAIAKRLPKDKMVGVEVGVWKGKNAAGLLALRDKLTLHLIDRWVAYDAAESARDKISQQARMHQKEFNAAYYETVKRVRPYGARAIIHKQSSAQAAPGFADGSLDFVFLDGDHSYEGLSEDIRLWLPKVKPGGFLGGHDYTPEGKRPGITKAVNEAFGEAIKRDVDTTWFYEVPEA